MTAPCDRQVSAVRAKIKLFPGLAWAARLELNYLLLQYARRRCVSLAWLTWVVDMRELGT